MIFLRQRLSLRQFISCFAVTACMYVSLATNTFAISHVQIEKIKVGMDGYVRQERWVPVVFWLRSTGDPFRGTLQVVRGKTIFRKSLHLGAGTTRRFEILYYHSNYFEPLSYQVLDARGNIVLQNNLNLSVINYQDNLLLVISGTEFNHQFLNGQPNPWGGKTFVGYMQPSELPYEWLAYSSADAIAVGRLSPSELAPAQWKTLLQYLASGGVLVLSAGTSAAVVEDPILRNNLPQISPYMDQTSNGDFLISRWAAATTEAFPQILIPTQTVRKRPCDRELLPLGNSSLITSSPYYKGNTIYFAFDYSRLPENVRKVFSAIWNENVHPNSISGPPVFSQQFRKRLEENPRIQKFLYDIPGLHLPDAKWFGLFFFVYICAIGPFQYFLLRLIKKNSVLWITFPTIILLFTVSSFGYSKYRHSSQTTITQATIMEIFPDLNQQTIWQVYGTTLGRSGTFRFQAVPENSYLRKFVFQSFSYMPEPYLLSEDLPREIVGETVKTWTFRTFDAISLSPLSNMPVSVSISVNGQHLRGEVTNHGDDDLESCFFAYDALNAANIGTLRNGEKKKFELFLNGKSPVPFATTHLNDMLHLYSSSYASSHFFFGEARKTNGTIIINGEKERTHLAKYIAVYVNIKDVGSVTPWAVR